MDGKLEAEVKALVQKEIASTRTKEEKARMKWRWAIHTVACLTIFASVGFAYLCFSSIMTALAAKPIDQMSLWVFALAGLYMSAVLIAGIIGISVILKDE
jgi:hypothetical protein